MVYTWVTFVCSLEKINSVVITVDCISVLSFIVTTGGDAHDSQFQENNSLAVMYMQSI